MLQLILFPPCVISCFRVYLTEYLNDSRNITGYSQVLRQTDYDAEGNVLQTIRNIIGHQRISQTIEKSGEVQEFYFTFDGHGSTRVLLDVASAVAELNGIDQIFHYDAYGQAIGFSNGEALTEFLYSGEQFDAKIGQQYLRARYYDPVTGRFNRLDPFFGNLTDPLSLHNYLYAHNDPINGVDPTGKSWAMALSIAIPVALGVGIGAYFGGWRGAAIGGVGGLLIGVGIALGPIIVGATTIWPMVAGVGSMGSGIAVLVAGSIYGLYHKWGVKPVSAANAKRVAVIEGSMKAHEVGATYADFMSAKALEYELSYAGHITTYAKDPDEAEFIRLCNEYDYIFIYSHGGANKDLNISGFVLGGTLGPENSRTFITSGEVNGKINNENLALFAGACCGSSENTFAVASGAKYYIGKENEISIRDSVSILQYGVLLLNGEDPVEIRKKATEAGYGVKVYVK